MTLLAKCTNANRYKLQEFVQTHGNHDFHECVCVCDDCVRVHAYCIFTFCCLGWFRRVGVQQRHVIAILDLNVRRAFPKPPIIKPPRFGTATGRLLYDLYEDKDWWAQLQATYRATQKTLDALFKHFPSMICLLLASVLIESNVSAAESSYPSATAHADDALDSNASQKISMYAYSGQCHCQWCFIPLLRCRTKLLVSVGNHK